MKSWQRPSLWTVPMASQTDSKPAPSVNGSPRMSEIDAFVETFPDAACLRDDGPLSGLTFGVKEIMEQEGRRTPWGLDILMERVGETDAPVIRKAEQAGARRIGTTRSTAMAIAGEARTRNPLNLSLSPGGSSAGSAAAVAAGLLDFAFGTQTVGSIVRPASYCGVPGFKPTFDMLSTEGVMPLSRELDHVGLIARDITTLSAVFEALTISRDLPAPFRKVLVPDLWFDFPVHPAAYRACDMARSAIEALGRPTERCQLPEFVTDKEALTLDGLLCRGIFENHHDFISENAQVLPSELTKKMELGSTISDAALETLQADRDKILNEVAGFISSDSVMLLPSVIDLPPRLGSGTGMREPQRLFSLLGWPVVSVPVCTYGSGHDDLSISVQLASSPNTDAALIRLAQRLENRLSENATPT